MSKYHPDPNQLTTRATIKKKFKLILVDDHEMFREGLAILISKIPDLELLATASSGKELKKVLKTDVPDVILMDVKLPAEDGIELTSYIRKTFPSVLVIALTMDSDPNTILKMLSAGASGYLLKNASKSDLREAVIAVVNGNEFYSPEAAFQVINKISQKEKSVIAGISLGGFSMREVQIIRLICGGKTNIEIADMLNVSSRTIEKHRYNIMKKMNVKSSAEMAIYAMKNNLIE